MFEQGQYAEAAKGFAEILKSGRASAAVYFNLGNTNLKLNRFGPAVYYFHQAGRLAPRDPDIRANLRFVRHEVSGAFAKEGSVWEQFLRHFSVREWAMGTAFLGALWFGFLSMCEARAEWRRGLFWPVRLSGMTACVAGLLCWQASGSWTASDEAVVVMDQAELRHGPLEESKVFHKFKNGEEVRVLAEKDEWVQVVDVTQRSGWIKREQLVPLSRVGPIDGDG